MDPAGLKLSGATALAIFAGLTWFAFIRKVPEQTALATIVSKVDVVGGTYMQQRVGQERVPTTPNMIAIAPSNAFELRVDGMSDPVRASFNTVKSRSFEPGQRVRIRYVKRGLPLLWHRLTVTDMSPADSG